MKMKIKIMMKIKITIKKREKAERERERERISRERERTEKCFGWPLGPHLGGFGVVSGRVGLEGLFVSLPDAFKKTKEIQKKCAFFV